MARERARWETVETVNKYQFQTNQYGEVRITMCGKQWKDFRGENRNADAKRWWRNIKLINQ